MEIVYKLLQLRVAFSIRKEEGGAIKELSTVGIQIGLITLDVACFCTLSISFLFIDKYILI